MGHTFEGAGLVRVCSRCDYHCDSVRVDAEGLPPCGADPLNERLRQALRELEACHEDDFMPSGATLAAVGETVAMLDELRAFLTPVNPFMPKSAMVVAGWRVWEFLER